MKIIKIIAFFICCSLVLLTPGETEIKQEAQNVEKIVNQVGNIALEINNLIEKQQIPENNIGLLAQFFIFKNFNKIADESCVIDKIKNYQNSQLNMNELTIRITDSFQEMIVIDEDDKGNNIHYNILQDVKKKYIEDYKILYEIFYEMITSCNGSSLKDSRVIHQSGKFFLEKYSNSIKNNLESEFSTQSKLSIKQKRRAKLISGVILNLASLGI